MVPSWDKRQEEVGLGGSGQDLTRLDPLEFKSDKEEQG